MKIVAILGSPRKNGNTHQVIQAIRSRLSAMDPMLEWEDTLLADADTKFCKGCVLCFNKGEAFCPCKDDIPVIIEKMHQADGVIFATPTYVADMSGLMKNFVDRLAFFSHRPAFYQKKAVMVSTTASAGMFQAFMTLGLALRAWGFQIAGQIGIAMKTNAVAKLSEKHIKRINKTAERFYKAITDKKPYSPAISSLTGFKYNHRFFSKNPDASIDYVYWKEYGWLEKDVHYYVPIRVNPFKQLLAEIISRLF